MFGGKEHEDARCHMFRPPFSGEFEFLSIEGGRKKEVAGLTTLSHTPFHGTASRQNEAARSRVQLIHHVSFPNVLTQLATGCNETYFVMES